MLEALFRPLNRFLVLALSIAGNVHYIVFSLMRKTAVSL